MRRGEKQVCRLLFWRGMWGYDEGMMKVQVG